MHSIDIHDFGPIEDIKLTIEDFTVIIGEQASGKSTVAKLIYYFRKFKNHFALTLIGESSDGWDSLREFFLSKMKDIFTNTFGMTKILGKFRIQYNYDNETFVTVTPSPDSRYLSIELSPALCREMIRIQREFLADNEKNAQSAASAMRLKLANVFKDEYSSIYIPAGRALLSRQSLLEVIQTNEVIMSRQKEEYDLFDLIDAMTRDYMREVAAIRAMLAKADWDTVSQKMDDNLRKNYFEYMKRLHLEVLKGIYETNGKDDFIILDDGKKKIPVSYGSSGQQEILWVLNIILDCVTRKGEKTCILIEEPETHLHPDAQYALMKFIAAFQNATGSQVLLTTHSPYVLSSLNNLFFAAKCSEKGKKDKIADVVSEASWIKGDTFQAFCIEQGRFQDIKDYEQSMIDISVLDGVASKQDDEYEQMMTSLWED